MKKLALISNINIDPLKYSLKKFNTYSIYLGGYNSWQSELLNSDSGLHSFNPEFIFLHIDFNEFNPEVVDIFDAVDAFNRLHATCRFIISATSLRPYTVSTYLPQHTDDVSSLLNDFITNRDFVSILNFDRLLYLHGYKNLIDEKYWYLGRIKYNSAGFTILSQELINLLNAIQGIVKKVLVLDLDNTLWGGVLGEEGWNGIQLSNEGVGLIYKNFQQILKQLLHLGVVLAIASKNNEKDVLEVFDRNNELELTWHDFAVKQINWLPKPDNLLTIAEKLNVGTDSLVFIDDSRVERAYVETVMPEVIVPHFPEDISKLPSWFVQEVVYKYFARVVLTDEDLTKTEQYKRNAQRISELKTTGYEDFLRDLAIVLTIQTAESKSLSRLAQLSQKTNQFNLSLKRYSEIEIEYMATRPGTNVISCVYEDKFGNEGIVGCAILCAIDDIILIDSLMLSCRVLGRKVENQFLDSLLQTGLNMLPNCTKFEAHYTPSDKNQQVSKFLLDNGFEITSENVYIKHIYHEC